MLEINKEKLEVPSKLQEIGTESTDQNVLRGVEEKKETLMSRKNEFKKTLQENELKTIN